MALRESNIWLDIKWVASKDNVADLPSRQLLSHVYSLPSWLLEMIRLRFKPSTHLFAGS